MNQNNCSSTESAAILAVDIGTTNLKCCLFNNELDVINSSTVKLTTLEPSDGLSEMDPAHLLESIRECTQYVLKNPQTHRIKCFGLSTQRNSFILWNKVTGETYTKFILWNDKRPIDTSKTLNDGFMLSVTRRASGMISHVLSSERYRAVSRYKVEIYHIAPKLVDQLKHLERKLSRDDYENVVYGTIETWLFWNMTKEKIFVTDITSASCSGFYDIFLGKWSELMAYFLQVPKKILPQVKNNSEHIGTLDKNSLGLGEDVPIRSVIGDCQASLIAECAFKRGDCVITIGTGSFISVNIGDRPISSEYGAYPLAGYKDERNQIYILHSPVSSAGICINWAKSIGLFDDYDELERILETTPSSNGVYFVPAFGFIEIDNGEKTAVGTGFIGLKSTTTKPEMLRAIFDSIAYSIKLRMELILKDLKHHNIPLNSVRISGGVSRSEVFCQFLSNLLRLSIEKSNFSYTSSAYGAAFLAGLSSSLFTQLADLNKYRKVVRLYRPDIEFIKKHSNEIEDYQERWKNALGRFIDWNKI